MNDLISRQAAIKALDERCESECEYSKKERSIMCDACHLGSAKEVIEALPTIDAVPVVRCKECRFSVVNENIDRKPLICGKTKMCGETTPDWFCAAGERSEE